MRAARLLGLAAIATVTCSVACSGGGDAPARPPTSDGPVARAFEASAAANAVPRDLLVAIAQVEGSLAVPRARDVDADNPVPAAGPLALRRGRLDTLALGASLVGAREIDLRRDADLALEAAARVLASIGARTGARDGDLASWRAAVEEMSGYADDAHRRDYARRVFALLQRGGAFTARDGEPIVIAPHPLALPPPIELRVTASAEYPGAEWFPTDCTGKCDTDRGGNAVSMIVIHDTEGGWDASVATLQNDAGKSVQYIVGTDGKVGQFVPESYTAWHAGNYYVNQRSVGIEHVGYSTQPYTEPQYDASAQLVAYLAGKYGVAKDRAHVIGHDQVPNGNLIAESAPACPDSPATCESSNDYGGSANHRDPGVWEWPTYMPRFGGVAKCDDAHALWNCSYDHSKAIRCANGVVEVDVCDGPGACESQPIGVDDVCHQTSPVTDAGGGDGSGNGSGSGNGNGSGDAGPIAAPPPLPTADASATGTVSEASTSGDGCNASGRGAPTNGALLVVAVVGLVLRAARRRRVIRSSDRDGAHAHVEVAPR